MSLDFKFNSASGLGLRATLNQDSTNQYWTNISGWVSPSISFLARSQELLEGTSDKIGSYSGSFTGLLNEQSVTLYIHDLASSTGVVGLKSFTLLSGSPILGYDLLGKVLGSGNSSLQGTGVTPNISDIFYWDISLTIDDSGSPANDKYTVGLFKNASPVTTAITGVNLQVIKRSDGTDLISSSGMTQIGSLPIFKLDATGSFRGTDGESYIVYVSGYCENNIRQWFNLINRDIDT